MNAHNYTVDNINSTVYQKSVGCDADIHNDTHGYNNCTNLQQLSAQVKQILRSMHTYVLFGINPSSHTGQADIAQYTKASNKVKES